MIAEYGGLGNVTQSNSGGGGDDWLLQVGGNQTSNQSANVGDGNSTIYQFGGQGDSVLGAIGVTAGNHTFIQVGGKGNNNMTLDDSSNTGTAYIEQYGGAVNNNMEVHGSSGDDIIKMYGGQGNNSMTYDVTIGNDLVTILGCGRYNSLTINAQGLNNYKLQDYQGKVLFQPGAGGSTITVANFQRITVLDENGKPLYTYNAGTVPTIIGPLLAAGGLGLRRGVSRPNNGT